MEVEQFWPQNTIAGANATEIWTLRFPTVFAWNEQTTPRQMARFTDHSLLPVGRSQSPSTDLCPTMQLRALQLYHQAWRDYRQVGCPYGETDEAMFVWYSLPGATEEPELISGKN